MIWLIHVPKNFWKKHFLLHLEVSSELFIRRYRITSSLKNIPFFTNLIEQYTPLLKKNSSYNNWNYGFAIFNIISG